MLFSTKPTSDKKKGISITKSVSYMEAIAGMISKGTISKEIGEKLINSKRKEIMEHVTSLQA